MPTVMELPTGKQTFTMSCLGGRLRRVGPRAPFQEMEPHTDEDALFHVVTVLV